MSAADRGGSTGQKVFKMSDIARLAGVSESTVSRALSDSPLINNKTKARIRDIAAAHNYTINERARNFRLQRTQTIATIIALDPDTGQHISDPFFLDMLGAIADALTEYGYDLLLSQVPSSDLSWERKYLNANRADGIIFIGQSTLHDEFNRLADRGAPMVVWGAKLEDQTYCSVGGDNLTGGLKAVRHLLNIGRRRIVFLGQKALPEVSLRYEGYRRALAEAGLSAEPELEAPTYFVRDAASRAVHQLIDAGVQFDAIFATGDLIAMSAIQALHERGLSVPDAVSVVGYDDIPLAAQYNPALTTIRQNIAQGGRALVQALLDQLDDKHPDPVMLPTELVVRQSCGGGPA